MTTWTNEAPSEPGYYWFRWIDGYVSPTRITRLPNGTKLYMTSDFRSKHSSEATKVKVISGIGEWWTTPIEEPAALDEAMRVGEK
jgi:hypothetical protein